MYPVKRHPLRGRVQLNKTLTAGTILCGDSLAGASGVCHFAGMVFRKLYKNSTLSEPMMFIRSFNPEFLRVLLSAAILSLLLISPGFSQVASDLLSGTGSVDQAETLPADTTSANPADTLPDKPTDSGLKDEYQEPLEEGFGEPAPDSAPVVAIQSPVRGRGLEKPEALELEKMVVTGTRTPRPLKQSPVSITVLTPQMVEAAPAKNLDDLLVGEKGVILKRAVGMGEGVPSDINIRGVPGALSAARVLIMVDGIPTNASGTPFLILNEIPVESVERIEVVRGPFSCLYGANAFSGVINVITKKGRGKAKVDLFGDIGSYLFLQGGTWVRGEKGKVSYSFNAGWRGTPNFVVNDSMLVRRGDTAWFRLAENYDYGDLRLQGNTSVNIDDKSTLTLHGRFFKSELGLGQASNINPHEDVIIKGQKALLAPIYRREVFNGGEFKAGAYFRQVIGDFYREGIIDEPGLVDTNWAPSYFQGISNDWQLEAHVYVPFGAVNQLTAGVDILNNNIDFGATVSRITNQPLKDSKAVTKGIRNTGVYVQDEININSRLFIVPGLRLDVYSETEGTLASTVKLSQPKTGWTLSPKIGVLFEVNEMLRLRSSAGRGFRPPSLSELYMSDLTVSSIAVLTSNSDLKPEVIWSYDAGVVVLPLTNLMLQADFFYNKMYSFITLRPERVRNGVFYVTFDNTREAMSYGIDAEAVVSVGEYLNTFINYTYTLSEDAKTLKTLDYIPTHRLNAGATYTKNLGHYKLSASFIEAYVGGRSYQDWEKWNEATLEPVRVSLDHYWRTDINLRCEYRQRVWAAVSAQNLFDKHFEEMGGFSAPGRFLSLKLGVSL